MKFQLVIVGSEHSYESAQFFCDMPLAEDSEEIGLGVLSQRHTPNRDLLMAELEKVKTILQDSSAKMTTKLLHGNPAEKFNDFADTHKPDSMLIGANGLRATFGFLLGGVAQRMVENAHQPVRVPYETQKLVLLVIDGLPQCQYALEYLTCYPDQNEKEWFVIPVLPPMPEIDETLNIGGYSHHYIEFLPASSIETEVAIARQAEFEGQEGHALLTEIIKALRVSSVEVTGILKPGDAISEIIESVKTQIIHLEFANSCVLSAVKRWMLGSVSHKLVYYAGC